MRSEANDLFLETRWRFQGEGLAWLAHLRVFLLFSRCSNASAALFRQRQLDGDDGNNGDDDRGAAATAAPVPIPPELECNVQLLVDLTVGAAFAYASAVQTGALDRHVYAASPGAAAPEDAGATIEGCRRSVATGTLAWVKAEFALASAADQQGSGDQDSGDGNVARPWRSLHVRLQQLCILLEAARSMAGALRRQRLKEAADAALRRSGFRGRCGDLFRRLPGRCSRFCKHRPVRRKDANVSTRARSSVAPSRRRTLFGALRAAAPSSVAARTGGKAAVASTIFLSLSLSPSTRGFVSGIGASVALSSLLSVLRQTYSGKRE